MNEPYGAEPGYYNQPGYPPPPRQGIGCFAKGCITVVILLMLLGIGYFLCRACMGSPRCATVAARNGARLEREPYRLLETGASRQEFYVPGWDAMRSTATTGAAEQLLPAIGSAGRRHSTTGGAAGLYGKGRNAVRAAPVVDPVYTTRREELPLGRRGSPGRMGGEAMRALRRERHRVFHRRLRLGRDRIRLRRQKQGRAASRHHVHPLARLSPANLRSDGDTIRVDPEKRSMLAHALRQPI